MLDFLCQVSHPHSTCDIPQKVQNYINAGSKHFKTTESGHMTLEAAELQIVKIYCGLQWFLQLPKQKFLKTPTRHWKHLRADCSHQITASRVLHSSVRKSALMAQHSAFGVLHSEVQKEAYGQSNQKLAHSLRQNKNMHFQKTSTFMTSLEIREGSLRRR